MSSRSTQGRHAMASTQPGTTIHTGAPSVRSPRAPGASRPPQPTPARRGVTDTPSTSRPQHAQAASQSGGPEQAPSGRKDLDYWKLKAKAAVDKVDTRIAAQNAANAPTGGIPARPSANSPGHILADGDGDRPGNSSSSSGGNRSTGVGLGGTEATDSDSYTGPV